MEVVMYCKYCGNLINDNSKFCEFCGQKLVEETAAPVQKGSGKAVASMVLGIIACVWSFFTILSFGNIYYYIRYMDSFASLIGFFIGFNLISLPTSIVGLCLGLSSKCYNGKRTSGIILSSISISIISISFLIMIINYIS